MWKTVEKVLQRLGLKKTKDKFIAVDGIKVRVVVEPYPPPPPPKKDIPVK